ncbi:hypothetical protein KLP28_15510 [Nocardioidaceae bacterium]|nr:hypothetical protein KLP28_15510 [Nocardioidaceae bacterium]
MAVDAERARRDLFPDQRFHVNDERVRHGDVVYYVRQVRDETSLTSGNVAWWSADPIALVFLPFAFLLWSWRRVRRARAARDDQWVVGIVALPAADTFQAWSGPRVTHTERVEGEEASRRRIDELVEQIRSGQRDFRPR